MEDKPKRPRINLAERMAEATAVKDDLEFMECLGSKNARRITTFVEYIKLDIWYDKHYIDRSQNIDESGKQRDVPLSEVQYLIERAFKHFLFYSSKVTNFSCLNHDLKGERPKRILIKDSYSNGKHLCIACEFHFKNFNMYEITVKTAIDGQLHLGDGQFMIDMIEECASILNKLQQKVVLKIDSCQD